MDRQANKRFFLIVFLIGVIITICAAWQARLRITLSAMHEDEHVDQLLEALGALPPRAAMAGLV